MSDDPITVRAIEWRGTRDNASYDPLGYELDAVRLRRRHLRTMRHLLGSGWDLDDDGVPFLTRRREPVQHVDS